MPPKRPPAYSTELSDSSTSEASVDEKPEKKSDAAPHPSTAIMVKEALQALDSRKGVSSQAILKYITEKYPSVDLARLKTLVRKNLKKGVENGTLVKPGNSSATTATRRFRLAPKTKPKAENAEPSVKKSPKAAKDGAKKPRKAGATKKKDAANEQTKSKEPPKKLKDEEASTSKVAPAKKPKAKKAKPTGDGEETADSTKTKAKKTKESKPGKAKAAIADSKVASKSSGKRGTKSED
ncbi:protein B4 isoform X2 [Simochromis diagramma]|uniref:protein B4 isoform X2 n=1 Tax=Simochromis diagramma TaxID=43689 RepID=UPI001A7E977B|nr:protein B4 isoform X2 [Simochromis diagramma]